MALKSWLTLPLSWVAGIMRYDEMPLGVDTLYMFHVVIVVGPWVGGVRTILIHFEDMV